MVRFPLIAAVLCFWAGNAHALEATRPAPWPGEQCRAAIAAAERGHGIPPQLLSAIGRVESGRRNPDNGAWGAWPWTINAEGQGSYFDSKADAVKAVEALRARGVRSIDVGCMQVNLMHHPNAFPNLEMAFEPTVNADYAARFLLRLYGQSGDWNLATASYHSANPAEGGPYAAKVTAVWPEEQRKAGMAPSPYAGPGGPGSGRVAQIARLIPPRPVRMLMMPGMLPMGMVRAETAQPETMLPGIMPRGMMQAGTMPGGIMPLGMMQAGVAPPVMAFGRNPGRGLDFYRAMPVKVAMPRLVARLP
jgi:hypothetical protein